MCKSSFVTGIGAFLLGLGLLVFVPGHAALILATQRTTDAAFESAGGFPQTLNGLPLAGAAALPQLERAVAQSTGSTTSSNTAPCVPNAMTSIPFQGAGVAQALTNMTSPRQRPDRMGRRRRLHLQARRHHHHLYARVVYRVGHQDLPQQH